MPYFGLNMPSAKRRHGSRERRFSSNDRVLRQLRPLSCCRIRSLSAKIDFLHIRLCRFQSTSASTVRNCRSVVGLRSWWSRCPADSVRPLRPPRVKLGRPSPQPSGSGDIVPGKDYNVHSTGPILPGKPAFAQGRFSAVVAPHGSGHTEVCNLRTAR